MVLAPYTWPTELPSVSSFRTQILPAMGKVMPIRVAGTSMTAKLMPKRAATNATQCRDNHSSMTWVCAVLARWPSGMVASTDAAIPA